MLMNVSVNGDEKGSGKEGEIGCLGGGCVGVEKKLEGGKIRKPGGKPEAYILKVFDEKANTRGKREPRERFGCFGNGRVVWWSVGTDAAKESGRA